MKKMSQPQMPGVPPQIQAIFNDFYRASQEGDIVDIGQAFTLNAAPTVTETLNVSSPTLANTNAVLATLILYLQQGGATKST